MKKQKTQTWEKQAFLTTIQKKIECFISQLMVERVLKKHLTRLCSSRYLFWCSEESLLAENIFGMAPDFSELWMIITKTFRTDVLKNTTSWVLRNMKSLTIYIKHKMFWPSVSECLNWKSTSVAQICFWTFQAKRIFFILKEGAHLKRQKVFHTKVFRLWSDSKHGKIWFKNRLRKEVSKI